MAAGPMGPGGPTEPTAPLGAPPPGYAPDPAQRFDRPPAYPPGYDYGQQQPGYDYGQQPPGRDRAAEAAAFARRHLRTPETKEFFKTSEFYVWALTFLMVLIAGAASATFDGARVWIAATVISAAYVLSRGISKAGARRGRPEE